MKREYTTGTSEGVQFFTGYEIEHTPAQGMLTLFVTGLHDADEIIALAKLHEVEHIYCGANQSFKIVDGQEWDEWDKMVTKLLDANYWVTLDFDVKYVEGIHESVFAEKRRFIPMISVKLPYIKLLNYNATIKLDDTDFAKSNPGVWCHSVQDLMHRNAFTDWDQYGKDTVIE
jgi:hypothetical protein